ncbi:MAG: hypothetical protein ACJ795_22260 [Ktedonobacteraceae bacterium]
MPKKSTTARGGAQRNKPKVQKSFELVRESKGQSVDEQVIEEENTGDAEEASEAAVAVTTMEAPEPKKTVRGSTKLAAQEKKSESSAETKVLPETPPTESVSTVPKGSAAAKLAARRQAAQKSQQRAAATLITAEHYTYVRKDLMFILILAIIMLAIIVALHFVPGIGS